MHFKNGETRAQSLCSHTATLAHLAEEVLQVRQLLHEPCPLPAVVSAGTITVIRLQLAAWQHIQRQHPQLMQHGQV